MCIESFYVGTQRFFRPGQLILTTEVGIRAPGTTTRMNVGNPQFSKFVMSTAHGRLVFVDAECDAYIVAITDKSLNIDVALLEMSGAAKRIRRMSEMSADE